MRIAFALLVALMLAGSAMAADIARGPEVVEGVDQGYTDVNNRGDVLLVNILGGTFTDLSAVYAGALANQGHTADIIYDPLGNWGDTSGYGWVFVLTSDNWWDSYNYGPDLATAGAFIDNGGCLFLIGQDFLYGGAMYGALAFVQTYCGVTSAYEDANYGDDYIMWSGTAGGPLDGLMGDFSACFASNPFFTDDVSGSLGVVTWESNTYGPAEGGSAAAAVFSTVEFGCDTLMIDGVVAALLDWCGPTPVEETTWGSIKANF